MRLFPESADADGKRVVLARAIRAFGDGYVSILLPAYLTALGLNAFEIGVLATATLLGSAALSLAVGSLARRTGERPLLLAATVLMAATGIGFALLDGFWPLLVVAFAGTLNPSSGDVSAFLPLEQSVLARAAADRDRTAMFSRYTFAGAATGALGTLAAALPDFAGAAIGVSATAAMQAMFLAYGALGLLSALVYLGVRTGAPATEGASPVAPLGPSKGRVVRLALLFSLDAFAGGFIVQSLLALWLFQAFGLSLATAATLFFWISVMTSVSYLIAPAIACRFGLIRTMVFSHLPANLCLVALPFVTDLRLAIAVLLVRGLLSQMDVPTRSSYVMAVVTPPERPAAASLTSVPRSLASAASPALAGSLLAASAFAWPLLIAGALKIVYDLVLLAQFQGIRPPEEQAPKP